MRIENAPQTRQEVRKPVYQTSSSHSFGQMLIERTKDRYVSSAQSPRAEDTFSVEDRTYGCVVVSNETSVKLKQLAEINLQADYTGMSPEEILSTIWNRYDEAFDGNMVAITACIAGPGEWSAINNQFVCEINDHIYFPAKKAARIAAIAAGASTSYEHEKTLEIACDDKAANVLHDAFEKVLGYERMSFEEREAAIREKYAGKNTTLDFLKMQSELERSGVLTHKMGKYAGTYCTMLGVQLDEALNPNSIYKVGFEKASDMTLEQWESALGQPFDTAKFAAAMKGNLGRISAINGYTPDIVKMMEDCISRFVTGAVDGSLDRLLNEIKK